MKQLQIISVVSCLMLSAVQNAPAQWTYSSPTATGDCSAIPAGLTTGFDVVPVVSRSLFPTANPLRINKMAFWLNPANGRTDLYLAEKGGGGTAGRVLYYNGSAASPTLTVIGTIPNVYIGFQEDGVVGIALNQQTFAQDNFLYFMYNVGNQANASASNGLRIARFTVNPTTKVMDIASQRVLIHIPAGTSNRWHQGGAMSFDNSGNLYVSIGDNEALANGPGNTADFRGGILRIRPNASDPRGYTIPAGNFGEYWAAEWTRLGRTARAAQYRDTSIVKAELYVKGSRNPYGMTADRYRTGWIAWSECGPDVQRNEEYNLTNHPAFSGWPFWSGNAVRQQAFAGSYDEPNEPNSTTLWGAFNYTGMTTAAPVNNWAPAAGADSLPAMHQPTHYDPNGCAQGGAIIRYDGRLANTEKLPPHLNHSVFYATLGGTYFAVKYDSTTGANVGAVQTVFGSLPRNNGNASLGNVVDLQQGPDGSLYSLNWGEGCCNGDRGPSANEGVARVEYTGTCRDTALYPRGTVVPVTKPAARGEAHWLRLGGNSFSIMSEGPHEARILDMQGRTLKTLKGQGWQDYALPAVLSRNTMYYLQAKTEQGSVVRAFLHQ